MLLNNRNSIEKMRHVTRQFRRCSMSKLLKTRVIELVDAVLNRLARELPSRVPAKCPAPARKSIKADRRQ